MWPLLNKFNSVAIDIKHWLKTAIRLIIFLRPNIQTFDFLALNNTLNPLANSSHKDNNLRVALAVGANSTISSA